MAGMQKDFAKAFTTAPCQDHIHDRAGNALATICRIDINIEYRSLAANEIPGMAQPRGHKHRASPDHPPLDLGQPSSERTIPDRQRQKPGGSGRHLSPRLQIAYAHRLIHPRSMAQDFRNVLNPRFTNDYLIPRHGGSLASTFYPICKLRTDLALGLKKSISTVLIWVCGVQCSLATQLHA
jgi:hypothetical protein